MAVLNLQSSEQFRNEQLMTLHRVVSDAVDRLSRIYNTVPMGERLHREEDIPVKVRHLQEVRQVAQDLAFAIAQQEQFSYHEL